VTHLVIVHYCVINVVKMGLVGNHYTCKYTSNKKHSGYVEFLISRSIFLVPCHFYLSRLHCTTKKFWLKTLNFWSNYINKLKQLYINIFRKN
jgi:hypothetical protein